MNPTTPLEVVAGVISNPNGDVLINQRTQPSQFAGQWEFPGGKIDPGETLHDALARELREELDIEVLESNPLISITHDYPHARVQLNVRTVSKYRGIPKGAEGQSIRWLQPDALREVNFLEANGPIINAVLLPDCYIITDSSRYGQVNTLRRLERLLTIRKCIVQVREQASNPADFGKFAEHIIDLCHRYKAPVLANADPEIAHELGFDGVQLRFDKLDKHPVRPGPDAFWIGASCHNKKELAAAERLGADFVILKAVSNNALRVGAKTGYWEQVSTLCDFARIPVYVLAGTQFDDLKRARDNGAQGVAMIGGIWEETSSFSHV